MFTPFFHTLRDRGIPVTPTSFLRLQKALSLGLIVSLEDLYAVGRSILVKSERDFDTYDRVFAEVFAGAEAADLSGLKIDGAARRRLEELLNDPAATSDDLAIDVTKLRSMTGEQLVKYFLDRLKDQPDAFAGGERWIGAEGAAPVGHSGMRLSGMRVGGASRSRSALKVAMERRYRDYSRSMPITQGNIGEALKRLRHLVPEGPRDALSVDQTIRETVRSAGEIELVFDRRLTDRLKVVLLIDNGGWSMDPYVNTVEVLFHKARSQFKDLSIRYFHNTINDRVWSDPARFDRPEEVEDLLRRDPATRLIFVGDGSMAPVELLGASGSIATEEQQRQPSIARLKALAATFRHAVWLNPIPEGLWELGATITLIRQIIRMFPLDLDGLEKAVRYLLRR